MSYRVYRVGLVSDTHGLVRPEAVDALRDSDLIIHCGDVGHVAVLDAFRTLAPVRAIRGNNDKDAWASSLPTRDVVEIGTHTIYVIHDLSELDSIRWPPASPPSSPVTLTSQLSKDGAKLSSLIQAARGHGASPCQ